VRSRSLSKLIFFLPHTRIFVDFITVCSEMIAEKRPFRNIMGKYSDAEKVGLQRVAFVCINVHVGTYECMYVCMYVMYVRMFVCLFVCLYVFVSVSISVRVCACVNVHIHFQVFVFAHVYANMTQMERGRKGERERGREGEREEGSAFVQRGYLSSVSTKYLLTALPISLTRLRRCWLFSASTRNNT